MHFRFKSLNCINCIQQWQQFNDLFYGVFLSSEHFPAYVGAFSCLCYVVWSIDIFNGRISHKILFDTTLWFTHVPEGYSNNWDILGELVVIFFFCWRWQKHAIALTTKNRFIKSITKNVVYVFLLTLCSQYSFRHWGFDTTVHSK